MHATLYLPGQLPTNVPAEGLCLPDSQSGLVPYSDKVAPLLGCTPQSVDVLACSHDFVAYSIFDNEGDINTYAMQALSSISGYDFDPNEEDEILRGPVLLLTV